MNEKELSRTWIIFNRLRRLEKQSNCLQERKLENIFPSFSDNWNFICIIQLSNTLWYNIFAKLVMINNYFRLFYNLIKYINKATLYILLRIFLYLLYVEFQQISTGISSIE